MSRSMYLANAATGGGGLDHVLQDEQIRLAQLTDAYGVDMQLRESRSSHQQQSKFRAHTELNLTDVNPLLMVSRRQDNVLVGQEVVAQIVLAHATSVASAQSSVVTASSNKDARLMMPTDDTRRQQAIPNAGQTVADVLRQEMKLFGLSEAHYLPSMSPIPFLPPSALQDAVLLTGVSAGAGAAASASPSPLAMLLSPHRATASGIHHLHHTMRESILLSCPCVAAYPDVVPLLESAMVHPMWSEPESDFFLLKRMPAVGSAGDAQPLRPAQGGSAGTRAAASQEMSQAAAGKGKIVLGTINQLVEQLTAVYFNPLSSRSQVAQDNANAFTKAFLRTYRLFLAPQALLSKLLQRYAVPSSLYIADQMDSHGIEFRSPADMVPKCRTSFGGVEYSARTAKWLKVSQLVKVKVLCVMHEWLRECPRHFDPRMLRLMLAFLEEQCFQPTSHADCPAMIMQGAEFVKSAATELLMSHMGRSNGRAALAWCPSGVRSSVPPTLCGPHAPTAAFGVHGRRDTSGGTVGHTLMLAPTGLIERLVAFHSHTQRSKGVLLRSNATTTASSHMSEQQGASRIKNAPFDPHGTYRAAVLEFLELPLAPMVRVITGCSRLLFHSFDAEALLQVAVLGDASSSKATRNTQHVNSVDSGASSGGVGITSDAEVSVDVFMAHSERLMHWTTSLVIIAAVLDAQPTGSSAAGGAAQRESSAAVRSSNTATQPKSTVGSLLQSVLYRVVELATELMECNDLHSAFGVVAGLNHPVVARLHRPVFSKRFMFHERIETLIDFFDLSTAKYANYMSHLPDDDRHPPVPFVHQMVEEARALHDAAPSFYRVPSRHHHHAHRVPPTHGVAAASAAAVVDVDGTGGWVPSNVVIHWRKFQALDGMLEDLVKYQLIPIGHQTYAEIQAVYTSSTNGGTTTAAANGINGNDRRTGVLGSAGNTTSVSSAMVAQVGALLEGSQWSPDKLITDTATLAHLSLLVHDPTQQSAAL